MENSDHDSSAASGVFLKVVNSLGLRIIKGEFPPGAKMPIESALCLQYGIGRNAAREAIKALAGKQLVYTERRSGTTVLPREEWNLLDTQVINWMLATPNTQKALVSDLTSLRFVLEPEIAAIAAREATTGDRLRILDAYEAMEKNANDPIHAIEADIKFHQQIVLATHNLLLMNISRSLARLLESNFEISIQANNSFIRNLSDHKDIAQAILDKDPTKARNATIKLLRKNENDLAEMSAHLAKEYSNHDPS